MRLVNVQFLDTPFFGVRQMIWHLRNDGHAVNEKRIRRLMRLMGIMPIYQKANSSNPMEGHKTYPYLLRGLRLDQPNQIWYVDITDLPMRWGFLFLVAIMDWHTRMVLSWRISNTLDVDFCVESLNHEAIYRFGPPDIMNRVQVHRIGLDHNAEGSGHPHNDGWQGPLLGQHLHRASVAHPEIRVRLLSRLGCRVTGPRGYQAMDGVLQSPPPAQSPWRPITGGGLRTSNRNNATQSAGADQSLESASSYPGNGEHLNVGGGVSVLKKLQDCQRLSDCGASLVD